MGVGCDGVEGYEVDVAIAGATSYDFVLLEIKFYGEVCLHICMH